MSDIWRCTTEFTGIAGLPGYNTLYANSTEGSASDFVTLVGEFWTRLCNGFGSSSGGLQSGLVATTRGLMDVVDSDTGHNTGTVSGGSDVISNGNGTGTPLPRQCQGLISVKTASYFGGRLLRGRLFIPCVTTDHSTGAVPSTTWLGQVQTQANLLAESALIIYSPSKHQWASVSSMTPWNKWAVLRSRRD